jgi:hypothetical protein
MYFVRFLVLPTDGLFWPFFCDFQWNFLIIRCFWENWRKVIVLFSFVKVFPHSKTIRLFHMTSKVANFLGLDSHAATSLVLKMESLQEMPQRKTKPVMHKLCSMCLHASDFLL